LSKFSPPPRRKLFARKKKKKRVVDTHEQKIKLINKEIRKVLSKLKSASKLHTFYRIENYFREILAIFFALG